MKNGDAEVLCEGKKMRTLPEVLAPYIYEFNDDCKQTIYELVEEALQGILPEELDPSISDWGEGSNDCREQMSQKIKRFCKGEGGG